MGKTLCRVKDKAKTVWCKVHRKKMKASHLPLVECRGLVVFALPQHLHVWMQRFDGVLTLCQLPAQGVAVTFGVHGMQTLHSPRFILDTDFYLLQSDFRLFDLSVNLLRQSLKSISTRYDRLRHWLVHVHATITYVKIFFMTVRKTIIIITEAWIQKLRRKKKLDNARDATDLPGERVVECVIPLLEEGHEPVPFKVYVVVVEFRGQLFLQEACTIQKFLYLSV